MVQYAVNIVSIALWCSFPKTLFLKHDRHGMRFRFDFNTLHLYSKYASLTYIFSWLHLVHWSTLLDVFRQSKREYEAQQQRSKKEEEDYKAVIVISQVESMRIDEQSKKESEKLNKVSLLKVCVCVCVCYLITSLLGIYVYQNICVLQYSMKKPKMYTQYLHHVSVHR